jgi:hypothetical protein
MANNPHRTDTPAGRKQRPAGRVETTSSDNTSVPQPALAVRSGGELEGQLLEIRPGTQVIGRQSDCELCIDDGFISRRHAIVVRDATRVTIQDTGSANGTRVNDEPLHEDPRALQSGDVVRVGRIDLVYLDGLETPARRLALLQTPGGAPLVEVLSRSASQDTPVLFAPAAVAPGRQTTHAPSPLTPAQLALSAAAAAVTALVTSGLHVDRLGQSWLGSMGAAALTSVVATVIQTRGRGHWWRLTGGAALAFALAVTSVSLPELGLHRALTNPNRPATFVPPQLTPSTTTTTTTTEPPAGPHLSVDPNPDACPDTAVDQATTCPVVTITSTGSASLLVRSFEIVGPAADEFQVVPEATSTTATSTTVTGTTATSTTVTGTNCLGRPLPRNEVCTVEVTFQPKQAGLRSATLIVHQNLPAPDTGTPVDLIGHGVSEPTTT